MPLQILIRIKFYNGTVPLFLNFPKKQPPKQPKTVVVNNSAVVGRPSPRNPHEYPHIPFQKLASLAYIFAADSMALSSRDVHQTFQAETKARPETKGLRPRQDREVGHFVQDETKTLQHRRPQPKLMAKTIKHHKYGSSEPLGTWYLQCCEVTHMAHSILRLKALKQVKFQQWYKKSKHDTKSPPYKRYQKSKDGMKNPQYKKSTVQKVRHSLHSNFLVGSIEHIFSARVRIGYTT